MNDWFLQEGGFAIWCYVRQEPSGRWIAWATFERLADFTAMEPLIKGARYKIKQDFETRNEAASACSAMAVQRAASGDVEFG
jgi:hypothetical protein